MCKKLSRKHNKFIMEESVRKHIIDRANNNLMFLFLKSLKYLNILSVINKQRLDQSRSK